MLDIFDKETEADITLCFENAKSIHKIQNLYFELKNQELTIL